MARLLGDVSGENPSDTYRPALPRELLTAPAPQRRGETLLWVLTLASFLGGTYYGYLFRKSSAPSQPRLAIVETANNTLVARWDGRAAPLAALTEVDLHVRSGGREEVVRLDQAALRRGEVSLGVTPANRVDAEWSAAGLSGHALFEAGEPMEPGIEVADENALILQLAAQKTKNEQLAQQLRQRPAARR
jgi:hypothetical protein